MLLPIEVREILATRGRSLAELGSHERGLLRKDALHVIHLLTGAPVFLVGGDVVRRDVTGLRYTYNSWYCNKRTDETVDQFRDRALLESRHFIDNYLDPCNESVFYVLVIAEVLVH